MIYTLPSRLLTRDTSEARLVALAAPISTHEERLSTRVPPSCVYPYVHVHLGAESTASEILKGRADVTSGCPCVSHYVS